MYFKIFYPERKAFNILMQFLEKLSQNEQIRIKSNTERTSYIPKCEPSKKKFYIVPILENVSIKVICITNERVKILR